jgi:hypothetical protein
MGGLAVESFRASERVTDRSAEGLAMSFPVGLWGLGNARRPRPHRLGRVLRKCRPASWLEPLESRRLLATLNIARSTLTPGALTFNSGASGSGLITVSISGSAYTFTDPAETIFLN